MNKFVYTYLKKKSKIKYDKDIYMLYTNETSS